MDATTPTQPASPASSAPVTPASPNAKDVLVLVTYIIPIVFIYTMMKKSDSKFHVFHSKNAAGYLVFSIGLNIALQILVNVMPSLVSILWPIINLGNLLIWLGYVYFGAFHAWKGEERAIPVITMIGSKLPLEKWFSKSAETATTPVPASTVSEPTTTPAAPTAEAAPTTPATPTDATPPAAPQA